MSISINRAIRKSKCPRCGRLVGAIEDTHGHTRELDLELPTYEVYKMTRESSRCRRRMTCYAGHRLICRLLTS